MKQQNPGGGAAFSLKSIGTSLRLCSDEKKSFWKMHFNIHLHVASVFLYLFAIFVNMFFTIAVNFSI